MDRRKTVAYSLLAIILAVLFILLLHKVAPPIANIIARGGDVAQVNINATEASYWKGFYGNLSPSGSTNITLNYSSPDITYLDIDLRKCPATEIFISTIDPDLESLTPASPVDVDNFLGLPSYSPYSGTSVFRTNGTFLINGTNVSAYATATLGSNHTIGIFNYNNTLVFVTRYIPASTGFDSSVVDYQFMLPVPPASNLTYRFFNNPCPNGSQINISARLAPDNESIILIWEDLGADSYSIYITDNMTAGFNYSAANLSGLTNFSWTDFLANQASERYYKIGIVIAGTEEYSELTVGKYEIDIYPSNQVPGNVEFNIISLPLRPFNLSVNDIFRWSKTGDTIMTYDPFKLPDPGFGGIQYFGSDIGWFGEFSAVDVKKAYWLGISTGAFNLTIVGTVPTQNLEIPIYLSTQVPGDVELNSIGWHSIYTKCNLTSLLSSAASAGDTLMVYDPFRQPDPGFKGVVNFPGFGWWGEFDCLEVSRGMIFGIVGSDYNWTYDPGPP